MIKEAAIWRGSIDDVYRADVRAWAAARAESVVDIIVSDLEYLKSADESSNGYASIIGNSLSLLDEDKTLVIHAVDSWAAPDVKKLVTALSKSETGYVVAFTSHKDAPAIKAIAEVVDEDFDRIVPKEEAELSDWIVRELAIDNAKISSKDANKLAEFCGENRDMAVSAIKSLRASSFGKQVTWDDVSRVVDRLGFVAPYKLTGAIASGNVGEALRISSRIVGGGMNPIGVLGMLRKRYFSYIDALNCRNAQDYAKASGGNPYAAKFVFGEAKKLGEVRIAKSIQTISDTDFNLKGGITGLNAQAILEMAVIQLTLHFSAASR